MVFELLWKEALILLVLTGVGIGPASFLARKDNPGLPLALAPAFGLALCAGLLETLNAVVPLRHGFWFAVLPMAAVSITLAVRRVRGGRSALRPGGGHALALAAVVVVTLGVLNYPMAVADSPGPVAYGIFDATAYLSHIDADQRYTNLKPFVDAPADWASPKYDGPAYGANWDLSARYAWGWKWQHMAGMTIPAVLSEPTGVPGWELLAPFMVVALLAGALGACSLTVAVARAGPGAAAMAGALVPGSALLQIFLDGSVGQMASSALMPLVLGMSVLLVTRPGWRNAVLTGIAFGGIQAVYPELLLISVAALGLSMLAAGVGGWRGAGGGRSALGQELRRLGPPLVLAGAVAVLVGLRSTPWSLLYPKISNLDDLVRTVLIQYNVGVRYLPGWLLQSREFYSFAFTSPSGLTQTLLGLVLPLLLVPLLLAALRYRRAWVLVLAIAVAVVQSIATQSEYGCSYCVQRSLLGTSTLLPVLLGCGLTAFLGLARSRTREVGVVLAALAIGAAVLTTTQVLERSARGLQTTNPGLEDIADHVADLPGKTVALEGFQSRPFQSWLEFPTTYVALREATEKRLSVVPTYQEWGGLAYLGTRPDTSPAYDPDYDWVVTRLGGIEHGRTEVYRKGPVSVQRRARPFDVIVAAGVATDSEDVDSGGTAWVQAPGHQLGLEQPGLVFWTAASSPAPAVLRLILQGPPGTRVSGVPGTRQRHQPDGSLVACVPVAGASKRRVTTLGVTPVPPGVGPPTDVYSNAPTPAHTVRLVAVRAQLGTVASCAAER